MSNPRTIKSKPNYTERVEFATRHDIDLVRKDVDLVRKDVDLVRKDVDLVREELKHDIGLVRKDVGFVKLELKQEIDLVKKDIRWLKWVMAIGLGTLLTLMLYFHGDTKADIREINKKLDFVIQKIK